MFLQDGVVSCIVSVSPGLRVVIRNTGAWPPLSIVPCFPRFAGSLLSGWLRRVLPAGLWRQGKPNLTHGAFGTEELSVCLEEYVCFSKKDKGIGRLEKELDDHLRNKHMGVPGWFSGLSRCLRLRS